MGLHSCGQLRAVRNTLMMNDDRARLIQHLHPILSNAKSEIYVLIIGGNKSFVEPSEQLDHPYAMAGVNVSTMLINAAAIEYGFSIPGMFSSIRAAIVGRDIPVLEALVLEGVLLIVIANFLVDTVQARLDPRVRARNR